MENNNLNDKFVEDMLKKAKEKREVKPQSRWEGVNRTEVEEITAKILGVKRRKDSE